jgi:hypothetical protein
MSLAQYDTKTAAERGMIVDFPDPRDPDKLVEINGKPVTITILGADAAKVRAVGRKTLDKVIEKIRKNKDVGGAKETEQDQIERLAAATVVWSDNWIIDDGEPPLVCSEAAARALYSDPRFPWIVERLQKKLDDRTGFLYEKANS